MFTISAPESPWLGKVLVDTLKQAVATKHAWQYNQPGTHAIITDSDGYVVSLREQSLCISKI